MSADKPIPYGQRSPTWLVVLLAAIMVTVVVAAIVGYLTYGRAGVASNASVLGNRAITQQLVDLTRQYELENAAHRERNEEAHACLIWLDVRLLHDLGDKGVNVKLAADTPCDGYTLPGAVPPLPTTTTTAPRRTTTRHQSTSSTHGTTTTTRRTPTTTTTTTMCSVPVQGTCVR